MWIIGVMRGKTRPNAKLSVSEDAFIIKSGLRIILGFVNWIRVMPGGGGALQYKPIWDVPFLRVSFFSINS